MSSNNRGLDVGTANILVAEDKGKSVKVYRERNVYLELPMDMAAQAKAMATKMRMNYAEFEDGRLFILGEDAFKLANMFRREVDRPMRDGTINPQQRDAITILGVIVEKLVGTPEAGAKCVVSVPAAPIDGPDTTPYHIAIVKELLANLGWATEMLIEGQAVVLSELAAHDFTGIGISMGGGMVNVAISYKAIPVLTFAVLRAGDYVDANAAAGTGLEATAITACKEKMKDLSTPTSREERAIQVYYKEMIAYVLQQIKTLFMGSRHLPRFDGPVPVVVAGGTSQVPGFGSVFTEQLFAARLPFEVGSVSIADDGITSVARGCLIAANM